MTTYQRERRQLAEQLRALRENAGLSGAQLARALNWGQPKVSKIETGKQLPSEDDVRAWASQTDASDDTVDELLGLLRDARVEYVAYKDTFRAIGAAGAQTEILALESQATRIGEFQPSMISGLVQTAEYAREALHIPSGPAAFGSSEEDIEEMVAARLRRQQALYNPAKTVQVIMLESALRVRLCSNETHLGQLDRLIGLSGLAAVDLRIVPFETPLPVFPMGFRIYDEDLVIVESLSGEKPVNDPEDIARYAKFFDLLRDAAVARGHAAELIQRVLADLRSY